MQADRDTQGARACLRCSVPCSPSRPPGEDARVLRRSLGDGLCANCAITDFLRRMSPLDVVLERQGPEVLLVPSIQAQVGRVLVAGNSDASLAEIDWPTVVANWDLPVKGGVLC